MSRREFHRHRILNLAIGKNSVEKTIAESIDGALNAGAFDKIDTSTNHAHLKRIVGRLTRSLPPAPFWEAPTAGGRRGDRPANLQIGTLIQGILPSHRSFLSRQYQAQPKQRATRWRDQC